MADQTQSSRIFIRGLPPSLTEDAFKTHFSRIAPVTDTKLLPQRRIGYVGYKSAEDAAKAVKYFHRTFVRMSKISVELARPAEEMRQVREKQNFDREERGTKRKLGDISRTKPQDEAEDPKLREFLSVMKPVSKGQTWANEDEVGAQTVEEVPNVQGQERESDDEYDDLTAKKKKPVESVVQPVVQLTPPDSDEDVARRQEKPELETDETSEDQPRAVQASATDDDWLRSRTSRLLGLLDDDEEAARPVHRQVASEPEMSRTSISKSQEKPQEQETPTVDIVEEDEEPREEPNSAENAEPSTGTGRLFVRNLSYDVTDEDLEGLFAPYGELEEIHVARDVKSNQSKGFAYVQYVEPRRALEALQLHDGQPFQGRLLHIIEAARKRENTLDEFAISKLPYKKQLQIKRMNEAGTSSFKWNSLYMNIDAVVASISSRLGVSKAAVLDPTSSDAAIKQAHAETSVIQETKSYFERNGIDLDAFKRKGYDDKTILVKNFAFGTSVAALKAMFEAHGTVKRILMPPAATLAIVEMETPIQARTAFNALAYKKMNDGVLFLEKAPKGIFNGSMRNASSGEPSNDAVQKTSGTDLIDDGTPVDNALTTALYVRNLNFTTTSDGLRQLFEPLSGFLSARVKTKPDPKNAGQTLSMGFGFVEFLSKEQAQIAMDALNGTRLDGHDLVIKISHKILDAGELRRKEDQAKKLANRSTKIIIKNLPFEASRKDVRALFSPYGQLRSVRVPRKFDNSTRGFAFAEFVTAREAENAMEALGSTHLLGRRLVLQFAAAETIDPEKEIELMQRKVGQQTAKIANAEMAAGGARRKFNAYEQGDEDA